MTTRHNDNFDADDYEDFDPELYESWQTLYHTKDDDYL